MGGLEALPLKFALCPSSKIKLFNSYHYAICIVTQMLLPPPPRKKNQDRLRARVSDVLGQESGLLASVVGWLGSGFMNRTHVHVCMG